MPRRRHPDRDAVEQRGRDGCTPAQAATEYDLNRGDVSRWFKKAGIPTNRRPGERDEITQEVERNFILRLHAAGFTCGEIERDTVYSLSMVKKIVAEGRHDTV